jgi:putative ABC transport system permease protein
MKSKSPHPPRLADKIFKWYCDTAMIEDLHGDVEKIFYHNLQHMSPAKAKLHY